MILNYFLSKIICKKPDKETLRAGWISCMKNDLSTACEVRDLSATMDELSKLLKPFLDKNDYVNSEEYKTLSSDLESAEEVIGVCDWESSSFLKNLSLDFSNSGFYVVKPIFVIEHQVNYLNQLVKKHTCHELILRPRLEVPAMKELRKNDFLYDDEIACSLSFDKDGQHMYQHYILKESKVLEPINVRELNRFILRKLVDYNNGNNDYFLLEQRMESLFREYTSNKISIDDLYKNYKDLFNGLMLLIAKDRQAGKV